MRDERNTLTVEDWDAYAHALALIGALVAAGGLWVFPSRSVAAIVALLLLVVVTACVAVAGRRPGWVATVLGLIPLTVSAVARDTATADVWEEFAAAAAFGTSSALVIEIVERAQRRRDVLLHAQFRRSRVSRVLAAASSGVPQEQVVAMVQHELIDEFDLEHARLEQPPRTRCAEHIDPHGRREDGGGLPESGWIRLSAEPVGIDVPMDRGEPAQLVLIPSQPRLVSAEQRALAADLARVLGGLLDADADASV